MFGQMMRLLPQSSPAQPQLNLNQTNLATLRVVPQSEYTDFIAIIKGANRGPKPEGEDSPIKMTGVLVGNFEKNP